MRREELTGYLDGMLEPGRFHDYCPNGLQVEGGGEIRRIVCGVTACRALIEAAIERGADCLLVHHGWFWKGEDGRITGFRKQRLQRLLAHDINLIAYHLPLDAHPAVGNNAQLAARFGWAIDGHFGEHELGCRAVLPAPIAAGEIAAQAARVLGRAPMLVGDSLRPVRTVAWCSGGAQGWFEAAIVAGADLFMSGEISEQTTHLARESGVAYLAAGHHATERYGVIALGEHLAERFGLECAFVDIDNPV
ncbi:MAG: Nif3-like dinuclear metal center hexameric protein [Rhodocyclaceae bacterium]